MKETDVFECLETGAQVFGTLLVYGPNTEELTCCQIVQRWLSRTTGAGLTPEDAALFLAYQSAEDLSISLIRLSCLCLVSLQSLVILSYLQS